AVNWVAGTARRAVPAFVPIAPSRKNIQHHEAAKKTWRVLTTNFALRGQKHNFAPLKNERCTKGKTQNPIIKRKTSMKQMTPMNRLIKFPDALSARRPNRPRGGFVTTTREQLAEIGRAFARGDKRTVDQVCEKLRATSLRRLRNTVSR